MVHAIEFASRDAASKIRNDPQFRGFLDETDDARTTTVRLKDATPEPALDEITGEAADSKRHEAEKGGQVPLTDAEKARIDFSQPGVNVMKARAIKGIAQMEGVDDWTAYADFTLTVDENRAILRRAKRDELGMRGGRDLDSDTEIDRRLAGAHHERQATELDHAKEHAIVGVDPDAQQFIRDQGPITETFDTPEPGESEEISVVKRAFGCTPITGADLDLVRRRHENRSQRAQTIDEQREAPITCDPIKWSNAPERHDYPGVDIQGLGKPKVAQPEEESTDTDDSRESFFREVDGERIPASVVLEEESVDETVYAPGLSPGDFEPGGRDSMPLSATATPFGLAGGEEADLAFSRAEEERAAPTLPDFTDDRPTEGQLTDFGLETDATQHRESRQAVEQASIFGIDDRANPGRGPPEDSDGVDQIGFEMFGGGVRENEQLF